MSSVQSVVKILCSLRTTWTIAVHAFFHRPGLRAVEDFLLKPKRLLVNFQVTKTLRKLAHKDFPSVLRLPSSVNRRTVHRPVVSRLFAPPQPPGFLHSMASASLKRPRSSTSLNRASSASPKEARRMLVNPCSRSFALLPGQQDRTLWNSREEAQNTHKTRRIVVQATYSVVSDRSSHIHK